MDLGNRLNGKLVLYLGVLANPDIRLNLILNCLKRYNVERKIKRNNRQYDIYMYTDNKRTEI